MMNDNNRTFATDEFNATGDNPVSVSSGLYHSAAVTPQVTTHTLTGVSSESQRYIPTETVFSKHKTLTTQQASQRIDLETRASTQQYEEFAKIITEITNTVFKDTTKTVHQVSSSSTVGNKFTSNLPTLKASKISFDKNPATSVTGKYGLRTSFLKPLNLPYIFSNTTTVSMVRSTPSITTHGVATFHNITTTIVLENTDNSLHTLPLGGLNYNTTEGNCSEHVSHDHELKEDFISAICGLCIIFIHLGVIGNLVTILALWRAPKLLKNVTTAFIMMLCVSHLVFCGFNLPVIVWLYLRHQHVCEKVACTVYAYAYYGNSGVALSCLVMVSINR